MKQTPDALPAELDADSEADVVRGMAPERAQDLLHALKEAGRVEVPQRAIYRAMQIPSKVRSRADMPRRFFFGAFRPAYALAPLMLLAIILIRPMLSEHDPLVSEQETQAALRDLLSQADPVPPLLVMALVDEDLEVLL